MSRIATWRPILLLVAAVAAVVLFAMIYGQSARTATIEDAREQAERRAGLEIGTLMADIGKYRVLPFVLTELPDVRSALVERAPAAQRRLDATLLSLVEQTGATVFYAIDVAGIARAASNAGRPDTFVGYDFRFRPYFVGALRDGAFEYFAEGSVTGRPGLFLARRVGSLAQPAGVIVVKVEFDRLQRLWRSAGGASLVLDRDGIVLIASDSRRLFRTVSPLSVAQRQAIVRSRQFGSRPLADSGLRLDAPGFATDEQGRRFIAVVRALPILGWRHVHLEPLTPALQAAAARTRYATLIFGLAVLALLSTIGWSATRRRRAEVAKQRLEAEVSSRTAELTQAYARLQGESDERARADARFRAAREELAQANRLGSIGTITTSVAHEMNQPVAAIRTAAENGVKLLARGRTEQVAENLSLIVSLTQRIGAITSELLSYGRRGRGERAPVGLDAILDGALMLIGDSYRRAGVSLDVARAPVLPMATVSRIRIEQVIVNLLQNALDAVAGRPDPRVRLSAKVRGHAAEFVVEDNGPGVADDLKDAVFQPFFTGKPTGTGLGLGISREIVEDHGGALTIDASDLGGALFRVRLPLDRTARP